VIYCFDDFEFDATQLELRRAGSVVRVDALVLWVLAALLRNAGELVSKEQLVAEVWGGRTVADNVITVAVTRLRKALDDKRGDHERLSTVYGRGYRFISPVTQRAATSRSEPAERISELPFVGRESALAELQQAWLRARRRRGGLTVLMGEPGIGKTHTVERFARALPAGVHVSWGACRETGDTPPLWPWRRLLRDVLSLPGNEDLSRDAQTAELADLWHGPRPADGSEVPWLEGPQRHRAFDNVARLLARAGLRTPLLLVIEDLHRADVSSLELLLHVLDDLPRQHVMVVATARRYHGPQSEAVHKHLARVLGHPCCARIPLDRLPESLVHSYVDERLGGRSAEHGALVFAESEGNPFFMAELCRQLLQHGLNGGHAVSVPDAALQLLREPLAGLDADTRTVLSAASVIGRRFELGILQAVTGRELAALVANVDAARAAELVTRAPDSATAFSFGHDLLRVVLYEALAPSERRRLHQRVVSALEQRQLAGESVTASQLSYHARAALPEGDLRKAVQYARAAATAAAASFANDDVVRHVRHAIEALDLMECPSLRLRMHLTYLTAMYASGSSSVDYEVATRELSRLARRAGDGNMLVRAATMFNPHPGYKALAGAGDELQCALQLLAPDDLPMGAVARAALALSAPTNFSSERALPLVDEAVRRASAAGSRAARYAALLSELYLRGGPEHAQRHQALLGELDLLALQNPSRMPLLPVDLAVQRAVMALTRGDLPAAALAVECAMTRSAELHHRALSWHTQRMRALLDFDRGELKRALSALKLLHAQAEQADIFGSAPFCAFDRVVLLRETGHAHELDAAARRALAYEAGDPPSLWALKLRTLATAGQLDQARTALRAVSASELALLPCDRDLLGTLGDVVHTALLVGSLDHAQSAAQRLAHWREHYVVGVTFSCQGAVPQLLGMVAQAEADLDRAVDELEQGLALDLAAGLTVAAVRARITLGRALLQRGRASDGPRARTLLAEAVRAADGFGLSRLAQLGAQLGYQGLQGAH
jgi:DNA-binding winged helix-turn-helix (wHTH) protein